MQANQTSLYCTNYCISTYQEQIISMFVHSLGNTKANSGLVVD